MPVGWQEQVADLDALIDHWQLAPATILGYSWGALLALLHVVAHPDRVERLALVSPAAATSEGRQEFEKRFAERMRDPRILQAREELMQSGLRERERLAGQFRLQQREGVRVIDVVPARHIDHRHADLGRALDRCLVHRGRAPGNVLEQPLVEARQPD